MAWKPDVLPRVRSNGWDLSVKQENNAKRKINYALLSLRQTGKYICPELGDNITAPRTVLQVGAQALGPLHCALTS